MQSLVFAQRPPLHWVPEVQGSPEFDPPMHSMVAHACTSQFPPGQWDPIEQVPPALVPPTQIPQFSFPTQPFPSKGPSMHWPRPLQAPPVQSDGWLQRIPEFAPPTQ
jgi:hypothetical protein